MTPRLRTMLGAQAAFMLGFASVVPFIAAIGQERYALSATAVGAVVGVRVAAQQGLFVVGGALADRLGPRLLLLLGCGVRAIGLALVGIAGDPVTFVVGVILIGFAGALFSPSVDFVVGTVDVERRRSGLGRRGPAPFAALAMAGEIGGICGAIAGAILMPEHAMAVALSSSAVFLAAMLVLAKALPAQAPRNAPASVTSPSAEPVSLPDAARPSVPVPILIAGAAAGLAVYTQLFSLIPLDIASRELGGGLVALVSVGLSTATIVLQWPLSRWAERIGRLRAVICGLLVAVVAAMTGAFTGSISSTGGFIGGILGTTILVGVALRLITPSAQSIVSGAGNPSRRATRLGALATTGGMLSLALSWLTGWLVTEVGVAGAWLVAAVVPAAGATLIAVAARQARVTDPAAVPGTSRVLGR